MTQSAITSKDRMRNRVIMFLLGLGLPVGPMHVLTVPGRHTGVPRSNPVAPLVVGGITYVCQAYPHSDWVKNARAAGHGTLTRSRRTREVDLVELPEAERAAVLREFPAQVPRGVGAFVRNGLVEAPTTEAFAAAAPVIPVFRATDRAGAS